MKKVFLLFFVANIALAGAAMSATTPSTPSTPTTPSTPNNPNAPARAPISIFSTSTDWEGVTGLMLHEYHGRFKYANNNRLVGRGVVLYYLDGFPCYGLGEGVRVWLGPNKAHDGDLRIACVHAPREIKFAWRNMSRDGTQAATTGEITCPVSGDRDFEIDLSKCTMGPDWDTYK